MVVSEDTIAAAGARIRGIASQALLQFTTGVGQIILEEFYEGDPERFRSHGRKGLSIRKIARQLSPSSGLSASTLCRCVEIHIVLRRIGREQAWRNLMPSHVRAVLALAEPDQDSVLREAEANAWSVRETTQAARVLAPGGRSRSAALPRFVQTTRLLDRIASGDGAWMDGLDDAASLDPAVSDEVRTRLVSAIEGLERVLHRLTPKRLEAGRNGDFAPRAGSDPAGR